MTKNKSPSTDKQYIGDFETMLVHDFETDKCKINKKNTKTFKSLAQAHAQGFKNCSDCIREKKVFHVPPHIKIQNFKASNSTGTISKICEYKNSKGVTYYLHAKDVTLKGGQTYRAYYFARDVKAGAIDKIPAGYKIFETVRTGLPVLKSRIKESYLRDIDKGKISDVKASNRSKEISKAKEITNSKGEKRYLNYKDVNLKGGRIQRIYYYSNGVRPGTLDGAPAGFKRVERERAGKSILKKP